MTKILAFLKRRSLAIELVFAVLVIALIVRARCHDDARVGFGSFGAPISAQGGGPVTSFAGVVDPTNAAYGMTPCTGSCSSLVSAANTAALNSAIVVANTQRRTIYIPPGQYPMACTIGTGYGVDFGSTASVSITGRNAVLRMTGNQDSTACAMLWIRNTSGVKIEGVTISMRDVTNTTDDTLAIKIGDGGTSTVDYTQFIDVSFLEGLGGDYVRIDGGSAADATVTRTSFTRSRFDDAARSGINVRPGAQRIDISYNYFKNNANRAIWFEDTGAGTIGQATIVGNFIESDSANPAVTLSGHGGADKLEQSSFTYNRIMIPLGTSTGGGTIDGTNLKRTTISYNSIITQRATSDPTINLTGDISDTWLVGNYIERRSNASSAAVVKIASDGVSAPSNVTIRANRIMQHSGSGPGMDLSGCARCTVTDNDITYNSATADSGATGFAGIYCAGSVNACSGMYARNSIRRDYLPVKASLDLATVTINNDTVIEYKAEGIEGANVTVRFQANGVTSAWTRTDVGLASVYHYQPGVSTVAGLAATFNPGFWVRVKTAGTGTNVMQVGDAFGPIPLANVTQSGRMLAGIEVLIGSGTTVGALVLRDNWIDGARAVVYSDANGSAAYPEGYPLISGNMSANITNEFEGGIATYRTETTVETETIASGVSDVNKHMSFFTTAGTAAYSLADAVVDGFIHCQKVKSVSGTPAGTWTPAHMADGTTHTITWSAAGGSWCVAWDATGATYRLTSITSPATLN